MAETKPSLQLGVFVAARQYGRAALLCLVCWRAALLGRPAASVSPPKVSPTHWPEGLFLVLFPRNRSFAPVRRIRGTL